MPLTGGTRIGPYEILSSIGAGGMGEVYRARDTRLHRDVAVKVLPDAAAGDPDRRERFEREAQAVAALSHPNILAIHDFGSTGHLTYAAMELLEGATLRERLDAGALPVRRAVEFGVQIARGLAAAHDKGLLHRDVKPENIFITRDGRVKILDFGLARLTAPPVTAAATGVTRAVTEPGLVMGTVGYMAPEQVRGLPTDARSDIFALGAVLYEMLAGRRAFARESAAETMTAIVRDEPPPLASPAAPIPPAVDRIVQRCLEKDPDARFQSCHDLAFALESATVASGSESSLKSSSASFGRMGSLRQGALWLLAGCSLGVALTLGTAGWRGGSASVRPTSRYDVLLPRDVRLTLTGRPAVAITRDGSTVAFIGASEGVTRVYVRARGDLEARALPGTEGAQDLAFSPDGRWVAITAGPDVKKVALDGPAVTLARDLVTDDSRGITWTDGDDIVFAPDPVRGLFHMPASGSRAPAPLTVTDVARDERTHRWPWAVAGTDVVLFTVAGLNSPDDYEDARIEAVRTSAPGERHVLVTGASLARSGGDGRLLFARGGNIAAVPFDVRTLTVSGTPSIVLEGVATDFTSGAAHVAVSGERTLVYVRGSPDDQQRRLAWIDRHGTKTFLDLPPGIYGDPRISPDGSRVALTVGPSGSSDIYVYETGRGTLTRLTFDRNCAAPAWSDDGSFVYYSAFQPLGKSYLMRKLADGSREAERMAGVESRMYIAFVDASGTMTGFAPDLPGSAVRRSEIVSVRPGGSLETVVGSAGQDSSPALSPDGQRLAYMSESGGRTEVFVRDLAAGAGVWQVSFDGGEEPHWAPDGRQLYYRNDTRLMAADIEPGARFRVARPRVLIERITNFRVESSMLFDVHPKDGRFLTLQPAEASADRAPHLTVILESPLP